MSRRRNTKRSLAISDRTEIPPTPVERLRRRCNAQRAWLRAHHPEVFREQKHLEEGSIERAYWHYGYAVALADLLELLEPDGEDQRMQPCGHA